MPITKSVKKSLRQSQKRRKVNKNSKKELKKVLKDYKGLVADKETKKAGEKLSLVYKKLDKAAKNNLIKKNKANRLKSRLSKKLK